MYAALYLPSFRLQAALRLCAEGLPPGPAALVDGEEKKGLIMEVNAAAQRAGVKPGLTVPRAMARCEKLSIVQRDPAAEETAHIALMQTAYALSPEVESTAPGLCTLRLRLPRGRDAAHEGHRAAALLEKVGLKAQAGLGPNPDLAFLASRRARPVLVVKEPSAFLDALPVSVLRPAPDMVELLQDWGIRTIRQLRLLPRADLVDRLGPEAGKLWERACGKSGRPLHLVDPPQEFVESLEFEDEVDMLEPLLFLLRRFLDHLTQRLRCMGRVAGSMTLTLTLERDAVYERPFSIPSPAADPDVLYRILFTHLESLRLEHRVVALALRLDPVLPNRDQFHLFETVLKDPNRLGETLGRLSALVGMENAGVCVRFNTHHPDAWRMESPQFHKTPATGSPPPSLTGLPLRRYRPALPADVKMGSNLPERLWSSVARGAVVAASGPYILSGQWWEAFGNPSGSAATEEDDSRSSVKDNRRAAATNGSGVPAVPDNGDTANKPPVFGVACEPRSGSPSIARGERSELRVRAPQTASTTAWWSNAEGAPFCQGHHAVVGDPYPAFSRGSLRSPRAIHREPLCGSRLNTYNSTVTSPPRWPCSEKNGAARSFATRAAGATVLPGGPAQPQAGCCDTAHTQGAAATWTESFASVPVFSSSSPPKDSECRARRKELATLEAAYDSAWSREEWDVELENGALLRLAHLPSGWTIEGYYELPAPAAESLSGFQPRIVS
ncbi:MAG TPA: DNA polymerase Y family protein [Verrucomicrobiales bacterium]|nr:DNA polymerase Y family protein [Verrucomicrobiales bacterium]